MKILILGNGFDLVHKLPTRYEDFLEFAERALLIYKSDYTADKYKGKLKKWKSDGYPIIEQIKEKLQSLFDNRDSETSDSIVTTNPNLDELYKNLNNNVWYNYFIKLYNSDQIPGKNWIDFEREISAIIKTIDNVHTSLIQRVFELNNFLIKDADDILKLKLEKFTASYHSVYGKNLGIVSDLIENLYKDLEKLTYALEIYLNEFVKLDNIHSLLHIKDIRPDHVITFNYTRTYEDVYKPTGDVCHIHGACKRHDLVLGIDEYLGKEEQAKKTDFAIFKKFIQRIRNHNDTFYTSWIDEIKDTDKTNEQSDNPEISDIYIYGHSLDVTDKDILRPFLKAKCTRIHIYAYDKLAEGKLISNLLRILDEKTVIEKASKKEPMLEFIIIPTKKK